jgi:cobalt-zinc-cadmium efflux system membrane fusion protein
MHIIMKGILFMAAMLGILGWISAGVPGAKDEHDHSSEKAGKQTRTTDQSKKTEVRSHEKTEEGHGHGEEKVIKLGEAEMRKFGIEVATAGPGNMARQLSLPGEITLNTDRMAHIVPRLPGVVREVRKTLGDTVKQGEVMAVIESRELANSKAEYLAALEKVSLAEAKFVREEALWKKKISAEMDYLEARQAWAEAKITLRSEEQKLHALGFPNDYLKRLPQMPDESFTRFDIVAPFDGTVIERHITRGEVLKDETDVFQIADLSSVWVNISVYQKDFQIVRKGQTVSISTGHDGNSAKAKIAYVSPLVKEETRTALARVILPNPSGYWRPGMFVNVKVTVEESSVPVMIPKTALQTLEDRTVVFVRNEEGFEARPVKVGRATDDQVEILSGLSSGEQFVAKGVFALKSELKKETLQAHEH